MIVVLHPEADQAIAERVASHLRDAFKGRVEVNRAKANSPSAWQTDVNWDDLLVVMFDGTRFPDAGNDFIDKYVQCRKKAGITSSRCSGCRAQKPPKSC